MMGMSLADIEAATWWQYQAMLWNWNDRHEPADAEAEAPDADLVARQMAAAEKRGISRSVH